ncbi:hypothetical protein Droror1_Dr00016126, partial [Drosera rotundifolia]
MGVCWGWVGDDESRWWILRTGLDLGGSACCRSWFTGNIGLQVSGVWPLEYEICSRAGVRLGWFHVELFEDLSCCSLVDEVRSSDFKELRVQAGLEFKFGTWFRIGDRECDFWFGVQESSSSVLVAVARIGRTRGQLLGVEAICEVDEKVDFLDEDVDTIVDEVLVNVCGVQSVFCSWGLIELSRWSESQALNEVEVVLLWSCCVFGVDS